VKRPPDILLILIACSFGSLAAAEDPPSQARPPVIVTTLQMDPEHPRDIVGWWASPTELVQLAADGRYRHWKGHDRFAPPARTGRWHRENHAVVWLETYALPKPPRTRAALWLRDDDLMATLDASPAAFRHRNTPPRIPADDLLGMWSGEGGDFEFRPDSTYVWTAPASASPIGIGGQRGRWRLDEDGRLRLEPHVPGQPPVLVGLRRDEGESPDPMDDRIIELESIAGPIRRPDTATTVDVVPVNPSPARIEPEPSAGR
jgi:hypothetical protein